MSRIAPFGENDRLLFSILRTRWKKLGEHESTSSHDPESFTQFVITHGLAGVLLKYHSKHIEYRLGSTALAKLRTAYITSAHLNRARIAQLSKIAHLFGSAGIDWVLLKGPGLSARLYGDPNVRISGDVDILVDRASVDCAISILQSAGFRSDQNVPAKRQIIRRALAFSYTHQNVLYSRDGVVVELHWRSNSSPQLSHGSLSSIIANSSPVMVDKVEVRVLDGVPLLEQIARHAYSSMWLRWKWLYDVIDTWLYVSHRSPESAEQLFLTAPAIQTSLTLASWLMGFDSAEVFPAATGIVREPERILRLRDSKIDKEYQDSEAPARTIPAASLAVERLFFQMKAHSGWRAQCQYLAWRALVPMMSRASSNQLQGKSTGI